MTIPCKTCITLPICHNVVSGTPHQHTGNAYATTFSTRIIRKCYILRVWLKSDPKNKKDSLVRYKEFIKFYNINKPYGSSVKAHRLKNFLKSELKRMVVKRVLKI